MPHGSDFNTIRPDKASKDISQDLNNFCIKTPAYLIKERVQHNRSDNFAEISNKPLNYHNKKHLVSEENLCDKNFLIIDEIINCVKQKNHTESHQNKQSELLTKSNNSIGTRNAPNLKHQPNIVTKNKSNITGNKIIGCYDESFSAMNKNYSSNPTLLSNLNNLVVMPKTSMHFNIFDDKKSSKNK